MVHALETSYRGYRFRSRLEARWAVCFDSLTLPWQYEPEGFLVAGHGYLPDFFLPTLALYAEVKSIRFNQEAFTKAWSVQALLLSGPPDLCWYPVADPLTFPQDDPYKGYAAGYAALQAPLTLYGGVHLGESARKRHCWRGYGEPFTAYDNRAFLRAVYAARAMRFEPRAQKDAGYAHPAR